MNTSISFFYTKNGKRPADDPDFYPESEWYKSAGLSGDRSRIINFNVSREPRFYAWFAFDGGDFGTHLKNGAPLTINLLSPQEQGYNAATYQRDNNVTGYFSQKFFPPTTRATVDGSYTAPTTPRPVIRLAELYLNLAECYANLGDTENALQNLNVIRKRAGVPDLTTGDITGDMTLVDWAINERFIELWGEGHRYYDVRRYKIAPQTMAEGMRTGLNAWDVTGPTFEVFNTPVQIDDKGGNYKWIDRMYVMPVFDNEVYKNPQMVQAPGY